MTEGNVEIVRAMFDAFNRRDAQALVERVPDDFEWRPAVSPGGLEGNVYLGGEGLRSWLEEVAESWAAFEARAEELIEVDERRVLALGRALVRGRASGLEMDNELAQLWEVVDGTPRRATAYPTREAGRIAAGLGSAE